MVCRKTKVVSRVERDLGVILGRKLTISRSSPVCMHLGNTPSLCCDVEDSEAGWVWVEISREVQGLGESKGEVESLKVQIKPQISMRGGISGSCSPMQLQPGR